MSWNWDHLKFFLALADEKSLSDAARMVGVSHSTVQRRIRAFEEDLGVHLFTQSADGYEMTPAGKALYAEASNIQSSVNAISRKLHDDQHRFEGEIVISTTDTLAYAVLPRLLSKLSNHHAGLRFTLKMSNRFSDIGHHGADIGIRTGRQPPPDLIGRKICTIGFKACASRSYLDAHPTKAFPQHTDDHRFIVLDQSYANIPAYRWLDSQLTENACCTTASNFLSCASLCRAGMGITLLPEYLPADDPQLVELPVSPDIPRNDLWILCHADHRNTKRVRVVRHFLFEELKQLFSSGSAESGC